MMNRHASTDAEIRIAGVAVLSLGLLAVMVTPAQADDDGPVAVTSADVVGRAAAPDWSAPITLSPAGLGVTPPRIAVSGDGRNQVSVWRAGGTTGTLLIQSSVSLDAGQTWSAAADLTTPGEADLPQVAFASEGLTASAVWWRTIGANRVIEVRTSSDGGVTWGSTTGVSSAVPGSSAPMIAMSSDGSRQTIMWQQGASPNTEVQASTSTDYGATWSSPVSVSATGRQATGVTVAASADGLRQTAAWSLRVGAIFVVQASRSIDGGATWSGPADLSDVTANADSPHVTMAADGLQTMIVWRRNSGVESRSSTDGGEQWSATNRLSTDVDYHYAPSAAMSPNGSHRTVAWYVEGTYYRVQARSSGDGGVTWGVMTALSRLGEDVSSGLPSVAMSDDGRYQTVAWSLQEVASAVESVQTSSSLDGGLTWGAPVDTSLPSRTTASPMIAMSANGFIQALNWSAYNGTHNEVQVAYADTTPPTPPPPPAPANPPSEPLGVAGVSGDRSVWVSWSPPLLSGSFAVSNYQVTASPSGRMCVTSIESCEVSGLTNGTAYTFEVRALSGAGWGPWSVPSAAVTPSTPVVASIVISGTRAEVRGWPGVQITGASNLEVGTVVVPWILFPEQTSYSEGIARVPVDEKGGFTWERRTRKEVTIYMAAGELVSNRVTVG